jgi:hypothetical protein
MDDDKVVQKIRLEDGRHAEKHVRETDDEVVVELHVEPERELKLSERVIEKKKPVVYERAVEKYNKNGEIIERKVESLDADPKLELRSQVERIKAKYEQDAEAKESTNPKKFVTREELKDALVAAVSVSQETKKPVRKLTANQEIEDRLKAAEKPSWKIVGLVGVIVLQIVALGYVIFWM